LESISQVVKDFIKKTTSSFGKCWLVLSGGLYFLESEDKKVLQYYKSLNVLEECWDGDIYSHEEGLLADLNTVDSNKGLQE